MQSWCHLLKACCECPGYICRFSPMTSVALLACARTPAPLPLDGFCTTWTDEQTRVQGLTTRIQFVVSVPGTARSTPEPAITPLLRYRFDPFTTRLTNHRTRSRIAHFHRHLDTMIPHCVPSGLSHLVGPLSTQPTSPLSLGD